MAADLVIFLGPPGAGKSVQSRILAEQGYARISSGDLLRQSGNSLVTAAIASGNLAPTAAAQEVLATALAVTPSEQVIVLDGFPRLPGEAAWLDQQLKGLGRTLKQVFYFALDSGVVKQRLRQRGREDDQPGALERKWEEFEAHTLPVIEQYRSKGILTQLRAEESVEAVMAAIKRAL